MSSPRPGAPKPRRTVARNERQAVTERIHGLWDEIADYDASRVDEALEHLLRVLSDVVGAANAYWLGAVRFGPHASDPLRGWRPRAIRYLRPLEINTRFFRESSRRIERGQVDESVSGMVRNAGTFRAHLMREVVSKAWFDSAQYDVAFRSRGLCDALIVVSPINRDAESYVGFQRAIGQPLFTTADRDLAAGALRSLKWFQRQQMLSHGLLVARAPLTTTERRVLRLLLTNLSEKEISAQVDLTRATTHTYVTGILRKFGVSGRAGLTALWLGHQPGSD